VIEESLAIYRTLANHQGMWRALGLLAQLSAQQSDFASAWDLGEQSLAIVRELGDSTGIAVVRITLGNIARFEGNYPLARSYYEQSLAHWRAASDSYGIAQTCVHLAYITLNEGGIDRAAELFRESLALNQRAERRRGMIPGLVGFAGVAKARQQPERAARLVGAATVFLDTTRVTLDSANRRDYDRIVADVRAMLDEAACATAWAEGRAMAIMQAVAYALEPMPKEMLPVPLEPATPAAPYPAGLTKREVEVLRLIAQGLTDAQVAERLVLSAHTVHAHLRSIYGKLGVTSRAAATRFAVEHSLL
jgi:ATP/maltotriose-dependent transcriptional regulator MalT